MIPVPGVYQFIRYIDPALVHFVGKFQRCHNIINTPVIPPLIPCLLPSPIVAFTQHILQVPVRTHQFQNIIHILQMILQEIYGLLKGLIGGIHDLFFIP